MVFFFLVSDLIFFILIITVILYLLGLRKSAGTLTLYAIVHGHTLHTGILALVGTVWTVIDLITNENKHLEYILTM